MSPAVYSEGSPSGLHSPRAAGVLVCSAGQDGCVRATEPLWVSCWPQSCVADGSGDRDLQDTWCKRERWHLSSRMARLFVRVQSRFLTYKEELGNALRCSIHSHQTTPPKICPPAPLPPSSVSCLCLCRGWVAAWPSLMLDASDYPQPQLPQAVSCAPVYAPQLSSDNRVGEERTHWRRFAMDNEGPRFHSA